MNKTVDRKSNILLRASMRNDMSDIYSLFTNQYAYVTTNHVILYNRIAK